MVVNWGTWWLRRRSVRADRDVGASAFRSDALGPPKRRLTKPHSCSGVAPEGRPHLGVDHDFSSRFQ